MNIAEPFLRRASEVAAAKPLVAYHCQLYAVQLVLESRTHLNDPDVGAAIGELLNKIEESKASLDHDIIDDKEKAFEYQFLFASRIFKTAFSKIQNHNVTKSTILEFRAAIDFLKVLNLWPELYAERKDNINQMSKYAKFHIARIMKALKAGEDPNDYVTPAEEVELSDGMLAFNDSSVNLPNVPTYSNMIDRTSGPENISDNDIYANSNKIDLPDAPDKIQGEPDTPDSTQKKPDSPTKVHKNDGKLDLPSAPEKIEGELDLPTAPVLIKGQKNALGLPSAPESDKGPLFESDSEFEPLLDPSLTNEEPKVIMKPQVVPLKQNISQTATSAPGRVMTRAEVETIWKKDEVIAAAQKKAKFAIGALNYEDIDTAIKELTEAINLLKGQQQ